MRVFSQAVQVLGAQVLCLEDTHGQTASHTRLLQGVGGRQAAHDPSLDVVGRSSCSKR